MSASGQLRGRLRAECRGRRHPAARETIPQYPGLSIAGYVRHHFADGRWHGDRCGCPDDRCIGYHHGSDEACGCLPVTVGEYADALRDGE